MGRGKHHELATHVEEITFRICSAATHPTNDMSTATQTIVTMPLRAVAIALAWQQASVASRIHDDDITYRRITVRRRWPTAR